MREHCLIHVTCMGSPFAPIQLHIHPTKDRQTMHRGFGKWREYEPEIGGILQCGFVCRWGRRPTCSSAAAAAAGHGLRRVVAQASGEEMRGAEHSKSEF